MSLKFWFVKVLVVTLYLPSNVHHNIMYMNPHISMLSFVNTVLADFSLPSMVIMKMVPEMDL